MKKNEVILKRQSTRIYFKNGDKVTLYIFIESNIGLKCVSELSLKYIVSITTSFISISF